MVAGRATEIAAGVRLTGGSTLTLGWGCYLNNDAYLDLEGPITFGDRSGTAVGVTILTSHHEMLDASADVIIGGTIPKAVNIGSHVWIGARAIIFPGVTIGDDCVIGAGAMVVRDCAPGGVYVGSPARRVRETPHGIGKY